MTQIIAAVLTPYGVAGSLLLLALLFRIFRRTTLATGCVTMAFLVIVILSVPHVSDLLLRNLESVNSQANETTMQEADAIVLLAGGLTLPSKHRVRTELGNHGDRLLKAFELYKTGIEKTGKPKPIIISGYSSRLAQEAVKEPEATKTILVSWGVPPEQILLESDTTNTRDSVKAIVSLAQERQWSTLAVVTSAYHMPRTVGLFSVFDSVTIHSAPANIIVGDIKYHYTLWIPTAESLNRSTLALHEYLGLAYNAIRPIKP